MRRDGEASSGLDNLSGRQLARSSRRPLFRQLAELVDNIVHYKGWAGCQSNSPPSPASGPPQARPHQGNDANVLAHEWIDQAHRMLSEPNLIAKQVVKFLKIFVMSCKPCAGSQKSRASNVQALSSGCSSLEDFLLLILL